MGQNDTLIHQCHERHRWVSTNQRLAKLLEFDHEKEIIPTDRRRLSVEDEIAIENAGPVIRTHLRLSRHYTAT